MRSGPTLAAATVLFLAALLQCLMYGQTTTSGALTGVIIDPSGAVVPDAQVLIKDLAKGTVQSVNTDAEGVYRFFFLPPARYTLSVTHVGFQEENRIVIVQLGPPVSVNVALKIAAVSNEMTVVDEVLLLIGHEPLHNDGVLSRASTYSVRDKAVFLVTTKGRRLVLELSV